MSDNNSSMGFPERLGTCVKCGGALFVGFTHHCPTGFVARISELHDTALGAAELRCRELEAALAESRAELEYWRNETCKCGHTRGAHSGHCHGIGTPEPDHCSVACQSNCRHFDPVKAALAESRAENVSLEEQNDALHEKMKALGYRPTDTCACSYEKHDHVCMVHSPQLVKLTEKLAEKEKELAAWVNGSNAKVFDSASQKL